MIVRICLILVTALGLWALSGCNTRFSDPGDQTRNPRSGSSTSANGPGAAPGSGSGESSSGQSVPAAPKRRVLPDLRSEPVVRVFLAQAAVIAFSLDLPATLADGRRIAAGAHRVQAVGGTLVLDGVTVPQESPLVMAVAERRFSAELDPPYGRNQTLAFGGTPVVRLAGAQAQLLEELPLESYLAGVLPTEMNPKWPVAALAAQAVAARSYATAKYLERFDRPWQLHWHYSVDMAYAGVSAKRSPNVTEALRSTRGQLLTYRDLPVPALFHACSGGATESAVNVWPTLSGADRTTPMTGQMPSVADDAAEAGASALGMRKSHWRWKANIPLPTITRDLQEWARTHPEDKLAIGTVTGIAVESRFPDSNRVAMVAITHKLEGRTRRTQIAAKDFRLAIDPGEVRSTWWDSCSVASAKGGILVLAGRGFGHGVGLSQVSAWELATEGHTAAEILVRFYPQALLERRW